MRKMVLNRNPLCADPFKEHGGPEPATEVHHLIPKRLGGKDSFKNLQALCARCHGRITSQETRRIKDEFASVTIVCGPPGSGKTTWVRERAKWGDLILDMDALFIALSGLSYYENPHELLPFVASARDAVIERLKRSSDVRSAWIITSAPTEKQRGVLQAELNATVVVLDVATGECVNRIRKDSRRKDNWEPWVELVEKWWADYER